MSANLTAPLPDGPFTTGAGTPGPDTAQLVTALQQVQGANLADAADITAAKARGNHTGVQAASTISDLTEAVQDIVGAMVGGVSGVTVSYNDTANTLTITGPGGGSGSFDAEAARDALGTALVGTGLISITVNDAADTITISTTATANASDAQLRDRSTHTGAQPISSVTGLQGALDAKAPLASPAFTGTVTVAGSPVLTADDTVSDVVAGSGVVVEVSGGTMTVSLDVRDELPDDAPEGTVVFIPATSSPGGDTTAPAVPSGFSETGVTATGTTLQWADNADSDLDHYLYRYGTANPPTGTGTSVTPSQATLTGLTAETTYYWQVRAADATGNLSAWSTADSFTTAAVSAGPTTIVSDDFNRTDQENLGTAQTGQTWQAIGLGSATPSRFDIASNQAKIGSFGGSATAYGAAIETGVTSYTASVDLPAIGSSGAGIMFRYADGTNYWFVSEHFLSKRVAGVQTNVVDWSSGGPNMTAGDRVAVTVASDNTITVKVNNITRATTTSTDLASATKVGIYVHSASVDGRHDNFLVTTP